MNVSAEIKNLFSYITCYSPQTIDLEMKLKPFIPDYIPAVGEIDMFVKVSTFWMPFYSINFLFTLHF
jgi:intraflagellar transport protein 46 homolog